VGVVDPLGRVPEECGAREDRGSASKPLSILEKSGAGDRDRTDDIQLGKLTFYH
jgi:hypothetical protein